MLKAFGQFLDKYKFTDPSSDDRAMSNQIATSNEDGAIQLDFDTVSQYMLNLDFSYTNQAQLIESYRETASYSIVDYAIEDIVSEMVSFTDEESPVKLDLSNIEDEVLSESMKGKVYEAWEKITKLLDLNQTIHRRAKEFYIDGRLAYQKVIDQKKPTDGLIKIIDLDTRFVTKYRAVKYDEQNQVITDIEEYFLYDEKAGQVGKQKEVDKHNNNFRHALRLNPETITYVTSGLTDNKTGYAISWLHKAVKPANQLRMMENALVIYRIVRAPERRIFYVDTGNMPKSRAEQYLRNLRDNYRNRMSFDPDTGQFKDSKHLQTMQEDFWLPRNANGRGTEVTTLEGGKNLDELEDVLYFQKQLYKALNIPISRLESDSMMALGRASEISRDELKFSRFVSKIRKRFNMAFLDLLKTELILTKTITAQEWENIEQDIRFHYALDQYIEEMRASEMLRDRIELADLMSGYVGKYVSNKYMRTQIFRQDEQEIQEEDKLIEEERNNKIFNPDDSEET